MIEFPILLAAASAVIAHKQNRSALLWFVIGFFLPVLGLVILLIVGPNKSEEECGDEQAATTTKLRNQLRLERNRRQEVERLLRCGQELNFAAASAKMRPESFDKKSHPAQPLQAQDLPSQPAQAHASIQEVNIATHWHIHIGQEESRYLSLSEIPDLYQAGAISETSLVWCEGMDDWSALENTALIQAME